MCAVEMTELSAAMKASAAAVITFFFIMICVFAEIKTWYHTKYRTWIATEQGHSDSFISWLFFGKRST